MLLRTYALARSVPQRLQYDRCMLSFSGLIKEEINPDVIWGVVGTESITRANAYAAIDAQQQGRRLYQIDLWYAICRRDGNKWSAPLRAEEVRRICR